MREKNHINIRTLIVCISLPLLAGCQGGGADLISLLGSLFGGPAGSAGLLSLLDSSSGIGVTNDGGIGLAAVHNPEPATLLLLGGGMAAMARFRSRKKS